MSDITDITDIKAAVANLSAEDRAGLMEALGVKKSKPKKEASPEYIAAKASLDAVIAENPTLIQQYVDAKESLRAIKGVRKVLATKGYVLDKDTGAIADKTTGEAVTSYPEQGWQSAMRSKGFTNGQVASVSKSMRHVATAPEPVAFTIDN